MHETCYFIYGSKGGIPLSLNKRGFIFLFIGIILLALSIFVTVDWSFGAWMTLFMVSLLLCTIGIITLIVHLIKQLKEGK